MCGIAGIIAAEPNARSALPAMTRAMIHRGPDDGGESYLPFGDQTLAFGHRRLSILDLSPAGHQPMINPRTGDQIIFNGEIYNFAELRKELENEGQTFNGHSDTEVLLYGLSRWGPEWLRKLAGMYAFAFYDAKLKQMIIARDSLGIKPLYVVEIPGADGKPGLLFASELRAILASGLVSRELDRQGLATFLAYGAVQEPSTIIKGIRVFPPGSYQVFHADGRATKPTTFWTYPAVSKQIRSEREALDSIRNTLDNAVREHMVADVPVGVFLSSGLDSTVIAGLAARHTSRLRTFTVGFADQPDMSELALAKETAGLFNLDHTEVVINGSQAEAAAVEWLGTLDQPSFDGLNVYIISKAVRALGITVALSGQGGDELFGGYPSFVDVPRMQHWLRKITWLPAKTRSLFCRLATARYPAAVQQKLTDICGTDGSIRDIYLQRRRAMSTNQLLTLGVRAADLGLADNFQLPEVSDAIISNDHDPVATISRLESQFYQGNMLLRDSDTNAMAHSLEIRVPILDQRVVDFVYTLPGQMRLPRPHANKHLLRTAFSSFLRPDLSNQRKRGFTLPISRWMIGPMRGLCEQALADLKKLELLDAKGIDAIWGTYLLEPESPIWSRAFMLVVFGTYLRNIGISR